MINISELLSKEAILLNVKSKDKISVIRELVSLLVKQNMVLDEGELLRDILKRENLESTGIGLGIAIPHARTKAVNSLSLAFGRSKEGVDFSSIDGKPSYLIFLIAAPEEEKTKYIMALAKLSKILRKETVRKKLLEASSQEEVLEIIKNAES